MKFSFFEKLTYLQKKNNRESGGMYLFYCRFRRVSSIMEKKVKGE
ncbi:hypothetical protein BWGOE7_41100 [Bacillus mycoides]|nr:hypothetical protein BWGOE7_41100 [Bacillus mycoides]OFD91457.1 hypothetical protein BWGOE12_41470 [Bacillus mycoides]OHX29416.1 hypothetical protein BWGOE5_41210 [Bacillus mycoides]